MLSFCGNQRVGRIAKDTKPSPVRFRLFQQLIKQLRVLTIKRILVIATSKIKFKIESKRQKEPKHTRLPAEVLVGMQSQNQRAYESVHPTEPE